MMRNSCGWFPYCRCGAEGFPFECRYTTPPPTSAMDQIAVVPTAPLDRSNIIVADVPVVTAGADG
jgi:hypothetical protein